MHESKEQKSAWIFEILSGKKEDEVSQKDIGLQIEIRGFARCIETVDYEEGLTQEYVEEMLKKNFFIGKIAYEYIQRSYSRKRKVKILFIKSDFSRIERNFATNGIIKIKIPVFEDWI